jgi:hypothetical protein
MVGSVSLVLNETELKYPSLDSPIWHARLLAIPAVVLKESALGVRFCGQSKLRQPRLPISPWAL